MTYDIGDSEPYMADEVKSLWELGQDLHFRIYYSPQKNIRYWYGAIDGHNWTFDWKELVRRYGPLEIIR